MAYTTDYASIRDHAAALLEAATPYELTQHLFRRAPRHFELREWADNVGTDSATLRKFQMRRAGDVVDPPHRGPEAMEREETMVITIAYPVLPALYGVGELDDLVAVMRSDATLCRDVLFFGLLVGQSMQRIDEVTIDRGDERVWFQDLTVRLVYTEAITAT